jgi:hypothetical protein
LEHHKHTHLYTNCRREMREQGPML